MEWISVEDRLPNEKKWEGQEVAILVNGSVHVALVMDPWSVYISDGRFLFSSGQGWVSDSRFAKPTHWMPLPEPPKEKE